MKLWHFLLMYHLVFEARHAGISWFVEKHLDEYKTSAFVLY